MKKSRINWLFIFVVIIPTLLSCYYFVLAASDMYISESRFIVRSPQPAKASGLKAMLQGSGFANASNDSYAVHDYILSRDALTHLNEVFDIKSLFSSQNIDIFKRFGGLDFDESFEALFKYYKDDILTIKFDTDSSITTVTVNAYSSKDAYKLNEEMLVMMEKFISSLNKKGRDDVLSAAKKELKFSEGKAMKARIKLANYRAETSTVDPSKQSVNQLTQISKLKNALIEAKAQLSSLKKIASKNSQITMLQGKVNQIQAEIRRGQKKITGKNDDSLVSKSTRYEELAMEQEFANKHYAAAVVAYTQALEEVQRKQLYLERIVQPNEPDKSLYPRRVRSIMTTFILSFLVWSVLNMLLAGVREHNY